MVGSLTGSASSSALIPDSGRRCSLNLERVQWINDRLRMDNIPARLDPLAVLSILLDALFQGFCAYGTYLTIRIVVDDGWYFRISSGMLMAGEPWQQSTLSQIALGNYRKAHRVTGRISGTLPGSRTLSISFDQFPLICS